MIKKKVIEVTNERRGSKNLTKMTKKKVKCQVEKEDINVHRV